MAVITNYHNYSNVLANQQLLFLKKGHFKQHLEGNKM